MGVNVSFDQLINELELLESDAANQIAALKDATSLEQLRVLFLGKNGRLSSVLGTMG